MFDLNDALNAWRRPFRARPVYPESAIRELEDHLLEVFRRQVYAGIEPDTAFRKAMARIGTEEVLRSDYRMEWNQLGFFRRYIRLLAKESNGITSDVRRFWYRLARLGSLGMGGFGLFMLGTMMLRFFVVRVHVTYEPSIHFYMQGMLHYLSLAATGVFNAIPFKAWESSASDRLRLLFTGWIGLTVLHNLRILVLDIPTQGGGEAMMWTIMLGVGPVLWFLHLHWHSRMDVETSGLSISTT